MVAILLVSGDPDPPQPAGWAAFDKWEHMAAYFVLGLLLYWAFRGYWLFGRLAAAIAAVLMGSAHGVFAELHQVFVPQRHSDANDAIADLLGLLAAQVAVGLAVGLRGLCRAARRRRPGWH